MNKANSAGPATAAHGIDDEHIVRLGIDSAFYVDEVPHFVENALETLYGNIYSSLAEWRITGAIKGASTYVLRKNGKLVTVLLFRREKNKLIVLNEVIMVNQDDVQHFACAAFAMFGDATVITFRAIETNVRRLPFPFQRMNYSENIVVSLPSSQQDYLNSLGNATRKNLNRHRNRLMRDFPSFSYRIYEPGEVSEQHVQIILNFNRERMARKNKLSGFDEQLTQKLIAHAQSHGLIWLATIDGRVCAGAICLRVGQHYLMEISSHDYAYDEYRLGTLCCYLAICSCIARGGKELHLLWGRYEYKYMLGGVQRDLDNLFIYRNRVQLLRNGKFAVKNMVQARMRQMKLWLQHHKNQNGLVSRLIVKVANILSVVKRIGR